MGQPLVKFTAAADPAAAVRMDLNVDSGSMETYPDANTFNLGSVELEGDPDALEPEYATRQITFDLIVKGTHAQARAQMSALGRELVRADNWLMYQQDTGLDPVWFKLKRSEPGEVDLSEIDNSKSANFWRIGVTLNAEALAYEERVTIPVVSLLNDPGSAQRNDVPNPSAEVNTTGWTALTNTAIARSTAQAALGSASFSMTASGSGNVSMRTASGTSGIPTFPGQRISVQARFRAAVTTRSTRMDILWYNAAGTALTPSTGATASTGSSAFTMNSATEYAPANAAFYAVSPVVLSAAAAEVHYVDMVLAEPSTLVRNYGDGSMAGWSWAGTAHNSVSTGNPASFALPTIVGDAPTLLRIEMNPGNSNYMDGYRFMFSLLAAADVPIGPTVWQVPAVAGATDWTLGTDTTSASADTNMSGGTKRRTTFATTPGMATRISGDAPWPLPAGTYKVLVRVARSDLNSTFALRLGQQVNFSYWYNDTVLFDRAASSTNGHAAWVDLGEMRHPRRHQSPAGQYGAPATPNIALDAQRLTGSGSLDIDAFLLVPLDIEGAVECRTLFVEFDKSGPADSTGTTFFDGDTGYIWGFNSFGMSHPLTPIPQGDFLRVTPGQEHFLTFLQQANAARPYLLQDTPDLISVATSLTLSYHPRRLWIGDG